MKLLLVSFPLESDVISNDNSLAGLNISREHALARFVAE